MDSQHDTRIIFTGSIWLGLCSCGVQRYGAAESFVLEELDIHVSSAGVK